jgi:DNA replication protein DnaC
MARRYASGSDAGPGRHLLAALDHAHGVVLGQVDVQAKTNEIPMLPVLLERIELSGATSPSTCRTMRTWPRARHERRFGHAATENLGHTAFLERLLDVEVTATGARRQASLERFASLPSPFRLEDFDFGAQPGIDKKLVHELATLRFLEDATNVLFIGPPGVGKTMLAVALARASIEAGYRTYYTTAAGLAARCHRGGARRTVGHHHALLRRPTPADHR